MKYLPRSLASLASDAAEEIVPGKVNFEHIFPFWKRYLKTEGYLNFFEEKTFFNKLSYPYMAFRSYDADKFLYKSKCPTSLSQWPVESLSEAPTQQDLERLQHLWKNLELWKRWKTKNPLANCTYFDVLSLYILSDTFIVFEIVRRLSQLSFE